MILSGMFKPKTASGEVYVLASTGGATNVLVLDGTTLATKATISVNAGSSQIRGTYDSTKMFVSYASGVSVISTASNTVTSSITGMSNAYSLAVSSDDSTLYVGSNSTVYVVDIAGETISSSWGTSSGSNLYLALRSDDARIYYDNAHNNVDGSSQDVIAGAPAYNCRIEPYSGGRFFGSAVGIKWATDSPNVVVTTVGTDYCIELVKAGTKLYCGTYQLASTENVKIVDLASKALSSTIEIPGCRKIWPMTASQDGSTVWAAEKETDSKIYRIDTNSNTVTASVELTGYTIASIASRY